MELHRVLRDSQAYLDASVVKIVNFFQDVTFMVSPLTIFVYFKFPSYCVLNPVHPFTIHNPIFNSQSRSSTVSKTDSSCNKNERFRILNMTIAL